MTIKHAIDWIAQNYFDGDENTESVVDGDDEILAMCIAMQCMKSTGRN